MSGLGLPLAASHPTYAQLQTKAAAARGAKKAELLSQLALLDYDKARRNFQAGQSPAGAQALAILEAHADEAMQLLAAEAAAGKKNGMKNVEIAFRKVTFGLDDLAHGADYRDQPRLDAAQRRFAARRQQLLDWMFAGKKRRHHGTAARRGVESGRAAKFLSAAQPRAREARAARQERPSGARSEQGEAPGQPGRAAYTEVREQAGLADDEAMRRLSPRLPHGAAAA